ncbi:MAG: ABC transporter permease [Acidobacteria bacterium]|jgi:NitT/TauT family transport system permease protein|nr:ABC transporter permease [Acidobacteriota bacterium]
MEARHNDRVVRIGSLALLVLSWELIARSVSSMFVPSFLDVAAAFVQIVSTRDFWDAIWVSHQAFVLGFGCAVIVGTLLGLAMGRWRAVESLCDPYLNLLLATPISAAIPVIILAVGLGLPARTLVVFLFSLAVIVVNTRAGLKTIEHSWIEMAHGFGATELQLWRTVLIPGALPSMMAGYYLGLGRALNGMIAVELLLVAVGIGRVILDYQGMFAADKLYATVTFVALESVLLLSAVRWIERRITPWAEQVAVG